ncbi:MAG: VWA domain-containing protein [Bdellovibrionales bacterium]|nr:VWA domain-containing protein [Bdellovibrionales bacterium]
MFRLHSPEYFRVLWLIPLIVVLILFLMRRKRKMVHAILGDRLMDHMIQGYSARRIYLQLLLRSLIAIAMVVALARPQLGMGKSEIKSRGLEIVFALDVSNSMLAEDDPPNRLDNAKRALNRLMDKMGGDFVGLVAFAGSSHLISPLTNDYGSIRMFLEQLNPESVSTQGTSFDKVIQTAMEAFQRGGLSEDDQRKVTRVLLIATDGEAQDSKSLKVASQAAEAGIRIFTLGLGTRKGAPVPMRDERGMLTGYKKDKSGNPILSVPNENVLIELAKAGQGSYYHVTFEGQEVPQLIEDLGRLERAEFASQTVTNYDEQFQIVLLLVLFLGLIEVLIGRRSKAKLGSQGRFPAGSPMS